MLRALVVDDEPAGRDCLHDLLAKHPDIELVAECGDVPAALAALRESGPDIVFLDVEMPGADGFRLIGEVGQKAMPAVVFVTAHEEYALRAFEVNAVDYLLKPFDEERFLTALARAREEVSSQTRRGGERRVMDRLPLRSAGRVSFLKTSEIEWIDAAHNYVRIHTIGGKTHVARLAISELESRLDAERFLRIHRSTIVNVDCVRELEMTAHGAYVAILTSDRRLTVSRSFRDRLPVLLGN